MYWRVLAVISLLSLLVKADKKSCSRIQINNEKVYGECCVFKKPQGEGELSELLQEALVRKHQGLDGPQEGKISYISMPSDHVHIPPVGHHLHVHGIMAPWQQMGHGLGLALQNSDYHSRSPSSQEKASEISLKSTTPADTSTDLTTTVPPESLSEESSSDVVFPTDQTPTPSITLECDNATDADAGNFTGKTILDNRNAVDVPLNSCPNGQARDPSGECVAAY